MSGVDVKFKLYNYAEYYTLATFKTAADGTASLTTGKGDLLVWATDGERFGYAKMDTRKDSVVNLQLNHRSGEEYVENLDIVPPASNAHLPEVSAEMQAANQCRITFEDSVRNAYISTFYCNRKDLMNGAADLKAQSSNLNILPNANMTQEQIAETMRRCEGNYEEIISFLNRHTAKSDFPLYSYLKSFSDKDMRDITADVLDAHITHPAEPVAIYEKGLLPARISNELVRSWRQPLADAMKKEGVSSVEQVKEWTLKNIAVDDTGNYYNCPISPMGVYELRHSDAHSRDIFFVAACRSLGIPAYIDNATGEILVARGGEWIVVSLAAGGKADNQIAGQTALTVKQSGNTADNSPQYWKHYTIQRFENGDFVSLDFEDDARVAEFPYTINLAPGYYCLSTGNRDEKGSVRSRRQHRQPS